MSGSRRISLTLWVLAALGCSLGTGAPVTVGRPPARIEIQVWQDGQKLPRRGRTYTLKPRPFVLRLRGAIGATSYFASTSGVPERKLAELNRPLVFFWGTLVAIDGNELWVCRERAEISEASRFPLAEEKFFVEEWGEDDAEAEKLASSLRERLGTTPFVGTFGRGHLPRGSRADGPRYFLEEFSRLEDGRLQGNFPVRMMGGEPVGKITPVRLIVFVDSPVDQTFVRVSAWTVIELVFREPG